MLKYSAINNNKEQNRMKMNWADKLCWLLIIVGSLNWGLVGFFKYNLVDKIFGVGSTGSKVVYDIVGLAAVYSFVRMLTMITGGKKA